MKSMQGTPYHVEGLRRSEGDPRRYWGRCRFVDFNTQICSMKGKKCTYCTACLMYSPVSEEEFKKRQREKQRLNYLQKDKQEEESQKKADYYVKPGDMIFHDVFGKGCVFKVAEDYIVVKFRGRGFRFSAPDCFLDSKFHITKKKNN